MRAWFVACLIGSCVANAVSPASAQPDFEAFLSPKVGEREFDVNYSFRSYFPEDVGGQHDEMHVMQHRFNFSLPVLQNERQEWLITSRVEAWDIRTDARIPRTFDSFPNRLWNVNVGTAYRHKLDNDWILGGTFSLGSASDQPFASLDEVTVNVNGVLRVPSGEYNAWLFLVNYSNNREFLQNIPIPGVAYQFALSRDFVAVAGVPASGFRWEVVDKLTLEGTYFIPRTVHTRLGYELLEPLELYAGFHWDNSRFMRSDRRNDDDRLFYYEKRVVAGLRWDINEDIWLDLSGGFAFDRFFFEGEDYGDRHGRHLTLSDGPLVMLQVGMSL